MNLIALKSRRLLRATSVCAALFALACATSMAQGDPPDQAGRISSMTGAVSIQPAGSDDWGQVYPNLPIGPGDRIFTDQDGRVEIQIGQSYIRIGPNTDLTLVDDQPGGITFGIAQGSIHARSFGFWPGQSLDVSTPNGDARLGQAGEFRTDVMPDQGATVFTTFGNSILVTGAGEFGQQMGNWQALELAGTNPVSPQWLQPNEPDYLDQWSQQRDRQIINAASYQYVSPEVPGAAELDANGEWIPDSDYGPMWFPRNVPGDWQPYRYGHWINRDPWGWVWVEDESWGYAPFHYGRWISYRGRWGWVPGPRAERPIWSPALVVFAGGGGVGVSAWFPLGPGEPYRPWYPCSPQYIDRVNISNIRESRVVHVQTTYVNIVNIRNVTNITYVNRTAGITAMRQDDFAAGRSVREASVAVDRRQFDHVEVVDRPAPVTRQSIISRPVAHPVPVMGSHPTFINQQGMQITAKPGTRPQPLPVRPVQTVRALPGRTVVAPPPEVRYENPGGNLRTPPNQPGTPTPPNDGRQKSYPNQPPSNNTNSQQPGKGPIAPDVQPTGRPLPPSRGQQEGYPAQPPANTRYSQPHETTPAPKPPPPSPQPENRNAGSPPPQAGGHNANQPTPPP
jgi:hypothetical protein